MSTLLFLTCFSQADKHLSTQTSLSHQYILSCLDTNTLPNKPDKKNMPTVRNTLKSKVKSEQIKHITWFVSL